MDKTRTSIDGLRVRSADASPKKKAAVVKNSVIKNTTAKKAAVKKIAVEDAKPVESAKKVSAKAAHEDFLKPVKSFDFDLTSADVKSKKKEDKKALKDAKKAEKVTKKKPKKGKKIVLGILIALFILVGGAFAAVMIWGNEIIAKLTGGNGNIWSALSAVTSDNYVELKTDSKGRTNILAFGTSGYDMDGSEGDGTHAGAQLTDSIMVISIDQKTGDVAMTSLPRDLKAGATCTATGKVNEVYWCNNLNGDDEAAGAAALQAKVTEILGVEFQYYAHLNWGSLVSIVDSIGGITVTLDEDVNDYYYTGTSIQAGVPTTLNGEQALGLARARHGTSAGDFTRGESQQKILIAIKDKILSSNIGLTEALSLISALGDNLRTDFNMDEIKTGVHLAQTLDLDNMRQVSLLNWSEGVVYMKTANINGISYVIPYAGIDNYTAIKEYIAKQFESNAVIREEANILVLNGTGEAGVAKREQSKLVEIGYTVGDIDDAPEDVDFDNAYYIYVMNEEMYGTKDALVTYYNEDTLTAEELPSGIDADGYDFVIILGKASLELTDN